MELRVPARRRLSVPELRAVELHECDRDSGARAAQSPQPEHGRRGQPGSLRIMNHDRTRLSCGSHGSIEAKPTGGGGCGRADGPGPERGERRPRADDAALRCRGRRVWVLKPRSSSISNNDRRAWPGRPGQRARVACPRPGPPRRLSKKRSLGTRLATETLHVWMGRIGH